MKYKAKPVPTLAIQLNMNIAYNKWGGIQKAKAGDWLLQKAGDTFTCDEKVFADTYRPVRLHVYATEIPEHEKRCRTDVSPLGRR